MRLFIALSMLLTLVGGGAARTNEMPPPDNSQVIAKLKQHSFFLSLDKFGRVSFLLCRMPHPRLKSIVLPEIGRLRALRRLKFIGGTIDDADIAIINTIATLEEFSLDKTIVRCDLVALHRLPNLHTLSLVHNVGDDDMLSVSKLSRIRTLVVCGPEITDSGVAHICKCKSLRELWLTDTSVTDESCRRLAGVSTLASLCIDSPRVSDKGVGSLAAIRNLAELRIRGTGVTDEGVQLITRLVGLRVLALPHRISDLAGSALGQLERLEYLDLSGTQTGDKLLKSLQGSRAIRRLFVGPNTTNTGLRYVSTLTGLQELHLDRTRITDEGLHLLCKLSNLRVLSLYATKITDRGVRSLKPLFPQLEYLNVSNTNVSKQETEQLREQMPGADILPQNRFRALGERSGR